MIHWLHTAFQTYILHTEHGNGYQWWSGAGSDLGYATIAVVLITHAALWYRQHNCVEPGCRKLGHPHPNHGHPVCRRHYHPDHAI